MTQRAVTGFGAGVTAGEALASAGLPGTVTHAEAITVPDGANPSKIGTYIQRAALDPASLIEVPTDLQPLVEAGAARLASDSSLALTVDMSASPTGAKMLARLAPTNPAAAPWLVLALVDAADS